MEHMGILRLPSPRVQKSMELDPELERELEPEPEPELERELEPEPGKKQRQ